MCVCIHHPRPGALGLGSALREVPGRACHLQPGVAFLGSDFSKSGEPSAPRVSESSLLGNSTAHKPAGTIRDGEAGRERPGTSSVFM